MTRKQTVRYKYDALGRRVQRHIPGLRESTKFIYDGLDVVMDDDVNTGVTKYQNGLGIDDKLKLTNAGASKYFLRDHLGSTVGLTDQSGTVISTASYDSFGNSTNNLTTRYQYTGREYDSFTGLQYSRERWYDPNLGRFISEDPIGFNGGDLNLYGYVRNQPLWFRDPRGLQPGDDVLGNPTVIQAIGGGLAAIAPYAAAAAPPVAVAAVGAAAIYASTYVGEYTANHPSNPFVNGPWNPFGTPYPGVRPLPPTITVTPTSRPYCQPVPRAIPFNRAPSIPFIPIPPGNGGGNGCEASLESCLLSQSQPWWNIGDFGTRKDCGACFRECKNNGGIWPQYKCPIN